MMFRHPDVADWEKFLELSTAEGWRVPQIERQLFQGPWSKCAKVLEVVGDFLVSSQVTALLPDYSFSRIGTTKLMVSGDHGAIDLNSMVAMASLGSFG